MAEDFARMSELSAGYFAGEQAQEGIAAFAAKRPPRWAVRGRLETGRAPMGR